MNHYGVYVRISNVNARIGDVHVRISGLHGYTGDVYFRNHRDDVHIDDWQTHDHDRPEVVAVRGLQGACEYLEYLSPSWCSARYFVNFPSTASAAFFTA